MAENTIPSRPFIFRAEIPRLSAHRQNPIRSWRGLQEALFHLPAGETGATVSGEVFKLRRERSQLVPVCFTVVFGGAD
jgi:hypothetical protein